ncbi:MAG: hypothetical protein KC468_34955 [Myxococcales bacterium]|nr:hypothetical protein [Myxococcales bacterium]
MCCFSRPVRHVSGTSIFARDAEDGRQLLVYSMNFDADEALAMILPLPVPPAPGDDAVRFIDLERYPRLFRDLGRAFPPLLQAKSRGAPLAAAARARPRLTVHRVGRFEASFVPTLAEFSRLDERFRVAPEVWDSLPQYRDYGFAVFKLRPRRRLLGLWRRRQTVHPMAFSFPRRDPATLFFPTVHVHDGVAPARAKFDHTLYCQPAPAIAETFAWERSSGPLGHHVDDARAGGVIDPASPGYRVTLVGERPNHDVTLTPPPGLALELLRARGAHHELTLRAAAAYYDDIYSEQQRRWSATARRHVNVLGAALRDGLLELERARREAWGLTPYDPALPEMHANGDRVWSFTTWRVEPGDSPGPCRVRFTVFNDDVEPQLVAWTFSRVPDAARVREVQAALERLLAETTARFSTSRAP